MNDTPDISAIGQLLGDRARAAILTGLMDGRALTATELSRAADVSKQTASSHLSKLLAARLVSVESVGRHRYFRLASHDVAATLENLIGLAARLGMSAPVSGPTDPAMRKARVCYDHLAGELGVLVFDSMLQQECVRITSERILLLANGETLCDKLRIDTRVIAVGRRPLCLACLDWSVRRHHLAGALGAAMLARFLELGWARRTKGSRTVVFSATGERQLRSRFRVS